GLANQRKGWLASRSCDAAKAGGAEGNRTPDLCSAIAALSHLSYSPAPSRFPCTPDGNRAWGRLPSRLFPPLQSLGPRGVSARRFGPPHANFNRNGARAPFVSSGGSRPASDRSNFSL